MHCLILQSNNLSVANDQQFESNVAERQSISPPFREEYLKLLEKHQIEASEYFQKDDQSTKK